MTNKELEKGISWVRGAALKIAEHENRIESLETALFTCLCSIDTMKQAGVFAKNALDTKMANGIIDRMNEALHPKGGNSG